MIHCKLYITRVNSLSVALRAGYLSVRTAEGAPKKWTYLLTYLH